MPSYYDFSLLLHMNYLQWCACTVPLVQLITRHLKRGLKKALTSLKCSSCGQWKPHWAQKSVKVLKTGWHLKRCDGRTAPVWAHKQTEHLRQMGIMPIFRVSELDGLQAHLQTRWTNKDTKTHMWQSYLWLMYRSMGTIITRNVKRMQNWRQAREHSLISFQMHS